MRKLQFGMSGEDVKQLQIKLEILGYANFTPSTFFGIKTHMALRAFQKDKGLRTTGIFDITEASMMGLNTNVLSNSEKFFNFCMTWLNKDITPKDEVDDDVACMATIDTLYKTFSGSYLSGKGITISTRVGLDVLSRSPSWQRIYKPEKGCIVLYATGTGNGYLANGHIFTSDGQGKLYSNSSSNGLFQQNYTDFTAKYRYQTLGGFSPHYFKLI